MASKSSKGKSSDKANANRVKKAVKKIDTSKSAKDNAGAIGGVVKATATSAARSKTKTKRNLYVALCVIIIIAIVAVLVFGYFNGWFDSFLNPQPQLKLDKTSVSIKPGETLNLLAEADGDVVWSSSDETIVKVENGKIIAVSEGTATITATCGDSKATCTVTVSPATVIADSNLAIHFLELGNQYTGDCVYIKAGDTDILIDAGSRQGSAATIGAYVDKFCTDGKLEYVIVTHAHQDHIAGFVGTNSAPGIFDRYQCENIIQFAKTDASSAIYKNYCTKRDAEVASGANLYTALDCVNNANGAKKVYDLTGNGSITMEVLYQKFYEQKTSDENDYSVCVLLTQGTNHYLFTGDLEEKGEESLVNSNPNLPEVVLFKGGHHGSYTASNEVLLSKIKPQYICVCCCAGSIEYTQNLNNTFPAQAFVDRIAKYTDRVYVTTLGSIKWDDSKNKWVDNGYSSMNGNIVMTCTNGEIKLSFSNNDTKLKDTEWFKNNRTMPDAWKNGTSMYHD